ncbi:MAG TPA: aminoacetone oxidase family FAD-binding enzyme, partial [Thermoanaerobaculia bacterium]|nr:aminoacetone oxidase family FAD-binding enzyme [Thermoanaerobaculia bacterium]
RTSSGHLVAGRVIIATGGRSVPKTGSDGVGYGFARHLGHEVTPLFPSLVPLLLPEEHWLTGLRGISQDVELRLREGDGRVLETVRGSMLFTHFGISGPAVLDISRSWIEARNRGIAVRLEVSFVPDGRFEMIEREWVETQTAAPRATVVSMLRRVLAERLAGALAERGAGVDPRITLAHLGREQRRALVCALVELELPVTGDRGFDVAEVTAGGVPLEEIDSATMASRRCERLFLCGEILDVDGRIGGFNFQWAWASGRLAGISAARAAAAGRS